MQTHTRWILAAALLIGSLFPYAAFVASGLSPFATFWEFACYRYFGAMSYFETTSLPFWIVQGMPMALVQAAIMRPFLAFDSGHIGTPEQIELFSYVSLLLAYILIGATLAICAVSRRLLMIDAVALGLAVLALFPMTRWYPYLFAPDYWIFELPLAVASTGWGIAVLRSTAPSSPLPRYWMAAVAGEWVAICFTQKPSLAGLGAFPILFQLTMPAGRITGKLARCVVLVGAFLAAHTAIFTGADEVQQRYNPHRAAQLLELDRRLILGWDVAGVIPRSNDSEWPFAGADRGRRRRNDRRSSSRFSHWRPATGHCRRHASRGDVDRPRSSHQFTALWYIRHRPCDLRYMPHSTWAGDRAIGASRICCGSGIGHRGDRRPSCGVPSTSSAAIFNDGPYQRSGCLRSQPQTPGPGCDPRQ
jgi:hypothetical protein